MMNGSTLCPVGHPAQRSGGTRSECAPFPTPAVLRGAVSSVKARPQADRAAAPALTDGVAPLSTMVAVGLAARMSAPEN